MTLTDGVTARRYRFGPLDTGGWFLGLGAFQCLALATGLLAGGATLHASGSLALAVIPVVLAAALAFSRWDGRPTHEWVTPLWGWVRLRVNKEQRWVAAIATRVDDHARTSRPPFLDGLHLLEWAFDGPVPRAHGVGVIADRAAQRASAVLRVRGREFALLERRDQERVLDAWGGALAGFCRERTPVARIAWSEWAAPAAMDDHLAFVREHQDAASPSPELERYLALVAEAGPLTTAHEALVTITIDQRRLRNARSTTGGICATLAEQVGLFTRRLEHAGLVVDPPLSPAELAMVLRLRGDPSCASRLARRAETLGEAAGLVSPRHWAPLAVDVQWRQVRVDQAWHRSYWIAEWPRLEVPADWLAPVVLHAGGIRSLTVVYEPVAASRSRRTIDRDATRLASDEEQRTRRGFRVRAQHRRAETEVLSREAELVAGYPEFTYTGFLTITANDLPTLDAQAAEWEQVAAQAGLELRALDGQHDVGLATALPIGRGPAPRRIGP